MSEISHKINSALMLIEKSGESKWHQFSEPISSITANNKDSLNKLFEFINEQQKQKRWCVGYLNYEAGIYIDEAFTANTNVNTPIASFSSFKEPKIVEPVKTNSQKIRLNLKPEISKETYIQNIKKIKEHIRNGDTYQVNYTYFLESDFDYDPLELFLLLHSNQNSRYSAYLDFDQLAICSASPELLFSYSNGVVKTKPMKGTRPSYDDPDKNFKAINDLKTSQKDLAENTMIVDMARNDLAKISEPHSLTVSKLYEIENYPTVNQMTTTVEAKTRATIPEILKAVFPAASITGAPKFKTSEIISNLEKSPREIYTGSIGAISPENQAQFNVAIRTAIVDKVNKNLKYGIGGGIVWDSDPQTEWQETIDKAQILKAKPQEQLFETIRWNKECGYLLLEYHLARLKKSAEKLGFINFPTKIKIELDKLAQSENLAGKDDRIIKLVLNHNGEIDLQEREFKQASNRTVILAKDPVSKSEYRLRHKFFDRKIYEKAKLGLVDFFDVVLWNEFGEITESTFCNIAIKTNNTYLTPDQSCGLLPGTFRQKLLDQKILKEKIISKEELLSATEVYLINSVRGWIKVEVQI